MTPTVSETTTQVYEQFPEHYRTGDEPLGWPLLRYLALFGDQAQEVDDQLTLLASGVFSDPDQVPSEWLDWLAQFVALDPTGLTVPEKRLGIASAEALLAGSTEVLRATIESLLGGQKRYILEVHAGGDPWAIEIIANVADAGGSTWDLLALQYPSWNAWQSAATWDDLFAVADLVARPNLGEITPAWIVLTVTTTTNGSMWALYERAELTWDQLAADFPTWTAFESEVYPWL